MAMSITAQCDTANVFEFASKAIDLWQL